MSQHQLSRRRLLQTMGVGALTGTVAATVNIPDVPSLSTEAMAAPQLAAPVSISKDPDLHLLRRITFGPTPELLARVQAIGSAAFIEEQLNPGSVDDSYIEGLLANFQTLNLTNAEIFTNFKNGTPRTELQSATILRAIYSKRQLYEIMVEFWSNHFNVDINNGKFFKTTEDREVIRPHALGRFADLLVASAQSPAMLKYLDNASSKGTNPNENYGRELLELHTMGAGKFSEEDVRDTAYCLTGWTVNGQTRAFEFRERWHYTGPLKVKRWKSAGMSGPEAIQDGLSLLDYLAHHKQTARYLARKLCIRFVGDNPPGGLIKQAAQIYLDHDTQIVPVLRYILNSQAFWKKGTIAKKFRRPFEQTIASLRATNAYIEDGKALNAGKSLNNKLRIMGQAPFEWHPPNGYPDVMGAWLNTDALLARWNFLQDFVPGSWKLAVRTKSAVTIDYIAILEGVQPQTAGELVDLLVNRLLFQSIHKKDKESLLVYIGLNETDPIDDRKLNFTLPQLTALILNSPYAQFR